MIIEVQFSLYPLYEKKISKYIEKVIDTIKSFSLPVEIGLMSSITYGESDTIFQAINKAVEVLTGTNFILVMTISNSCPFPYRKEKQ